MKGFSIDLSEYVGKNPVVRIRIYTRIYELIDFDTEIKNETKKKKKVKTKKIRRDRIITNNGILSNPVAIYSQNQFEIL